MKPQEINWNEWEEVRPPAQFKLSDPNILEIQVDGSMFYFKKKEVFPKVFENDSYIFTVKESGEIIIYARLIKRTFFFDDSLSELIEAVECAKKQMEKNK